MSPPGSSTTPSARPDPDILLERIRAEEASARRGKLKVFLGSAAGVGKTYAMLEAAREQHANGVDVVVGWVQPHGRAETEALLVGLEILPARRISYRGIEVDEFDLDAALGRAPAIVVLDELAHTNAPGARHAKRWQDVVELLDAGVSVYTTVNIQHIESLNDIVAQITGVAVRETVPDWIVDTAEEVELIDLPPDDLLLRLREGKVYVPDQASEAMRSFFRKGNLIALRELALRRTAARVDEQMRDYRRAHAIASPWPAAERILVCISASGLAPRLVRAGHRMASGLHAEWIVAHVETPRLRGTTDEEREGVLRAMRLAEQLGAETTTLTGDAVSAAILQAAHERNVSKVVIGKPIHPRWRDRMFGSVLDEVVRGSGAIDVFVISGEPDTEATSSLPTAFRPTGGYAPLPAYGASLLQIVACTLIVLAMQPNFQHANLIMVYLLGVAFVAARGYRGPAIVSCVLSVAAFDFLFVEPPMTLSVSDTEYVVTFAVMLAVALLISSLTLRLRHRAEDAQERELRTAALYALSRDLASTRGEDNLLRAAVRHIREAFHGAVAVLRPDQDGELVVAAESPPGFEFDPSERGVARWVLKNGRPAGAGAQTLPGAKGLYLPLTGAHGVAGVLGLRVGSGSPPPDYELLHMLETFGSQTALALERSQLAEAAETARVRAEGERLRSTLLSAVSHELRSPLAGIMGSASSVLDDPAMDATTRTELVQSIYDESVRLNQLVANLLDMTRLQYGAMHVHRELQSVEELIGSAVLSREPALRGHTVNVAIPPDMPLVAVDPVLIEQVLVNLLENAARYSPPDSPIEIRSDIDSGTFSVDVLDRGPGLPDGRERDVFEAFYRGPRATGGGVGLGLAICAGIVRAHGGEISASNRPGGGAHFRLVLPIGLDAVDRSTPAPQPESAAAAPRHE